MHRDIQSPPRATAPLARPGAPRARRIPIEPREARSLSLPPVPDGGIRRPAPRPATLAAFCAAALAALTLSCATIGHRFPPERVAGIQNGKTTKAQLLGDFGLPYRRGIEDGDSTWTYVYYKVRLFGENLRTRDLYLRFDSDGRVKSYTYNSNLDD